MRHLTSLVAGAFAVVLLCAVASAQYGGWTIPPTAKEEKSPLKPGADVVKNGQAIFQANCQRCHGPAGKGDGPDSDPKDPAADLSDDFRTPLNPDGVLYYKVLNGHPPQMPAFDSKLSKNEIWSVVEYIKTLRKP